MQWQTLASATKKIKRGEGKTVMGAGWSRDLALRKWHRRGGGGGTSQVEGRWSLGTRPEAEAERGEGSRRQCVALAGGDPPGIPSECRLQEPEHLCRGVVWPDFCIYKVTWLLWRMDKDLAWVKVVKVDQARAGTGLAEGHRGRGLQEVTRKNEAKIQYNTGIAEEGTND